MNRRLDWADYRFEELGGCDAMRTIAILPTAAIEQHGPHLPVGTDTMIAEGMLAELRRTVPDDLDIRILPVQAVGKSNEHLHAPGTLSLRAETALALWTDIGLSVARAGLRKIVFVNSHGGNADLISIVARELRVRADMLAVKCSWGSFGYPDALFTEAEINTGIHGGDVETSLMLALAPDSVDMSRAANNVSDAMAAPIPPIGPVSYGWIASDLHDSGTLGDASAATPAKGTATIAHQVGGFVDMLHNLRQMPLPPVSER